MESPTSDLMEINENGSCSYAYITIDRTSPWHDEGKVNVCI